MYFFPLSQNAFHISLPPPTFWPWPVNWSCDPFNLEKMKRNSGTSLKALSAVASTLRDWSLCIETVFAHIGPLFLENSCYFCPKLWHVLAPACICLFVLTCKPFICSSFIFYIRLNLLQRIDNLGQFTPRLSIWQGPLMSRASDKLVTYLPFAAMPACESIHPQVSTHGQMPRAILTSAGSDCLCGETFPPLESWWDHTLAICRSCI